jgi:RNA polymerase sigma-70 factor (ECF subfamily)
MLAMAMAFSGVVESEPRSIARALRRRDPEFIDRLVSQYHYRLLRYLVYLTGRREQAEDLVQETWIRVIERGAQYNGRSRFEPWLFSIARNLALDDLRRSKPAPDAGLSQIAAPDVCSPFATAAKSEDAARMAAALQSLEPIYREALLLRFQEELSLEEIAAVAVAPVSTISSRIQRGLAILRASLEGASDAV